MTPGIDPRGDGPLWLHEVYLVQLRDHALALLWLGYQRMNLADFALAEEDEITGELVRQMKAVTEDEAAPLWVEHYSVYEQVRSNVPARRGKRRPIVDVEFERHKRGVRPRLTFEAKRLGRGAGVADYLGDEGLGAVLDDFYARTHGEAGMLGYVQSDTETVWAARLSAAINIDAARFRLVAEGAWHEFPGTGYSPHTYRTRHSDLADLPLDILHVLLQFAR